MKELPYTPKAVIGRLEMVTLPTIGMSLCAKIDTGARTSALHAEDIEVYEEEGHLWVSFTTRCGGPKLRRIATGPTCTTGVASPAPTVSANGATSSAPPCSWAGWR